GYDRHGRRSAPALLLPLGSGHRTLRPAGPRRRPRGWRGHGRGARRGDRLVAPPRARARGRCMTSLFLPEQASTIAPQTDALLFFLLGISLFFALLIAGLIVVFMVRYRRRPGVDHVPETPGSLALEGLWTVVPLAIAMGTFLWGASLYATIAHPPKDAMVINVVGKQWMWKLQHL